MQNKILMLLQGTFPPDIRLEKEIKSLSEVGYQVLVVCNQYEKGLNPDFSNCDIKRVKALFKLSWLNRIINFPIFFNPRYLTKVFTCIVRFEPNYIHAHDLPMMPIAIFFGKLFRLPVIFDMHENYPEALKFFNKKGLLNFIFKNNYLARILEKFCLKHSTRVLVVVEENRLRLVNLGVEKKNLYLISNTVDLDTFKLEGVKLSIDEFEKFDRPVIIYSGIVSPERGLFTAITSARFYENLGIDVIIAIMGEGPYKNFLEKYVIQNDLSNHVLFLNWPGHEKIPAYIESATICMIPQPANDFINTTVPHKLFEYMAMRKPLLVSDALPLKRIVESTNSGLVFKSSDPEDFANKALQILESDIPFGANGYKAVVEKYNWAKDAKSLIKMYNDLRNKLQ